MVLATVNVRESNGSGQTVTTLNNDGTGRSDYCASDGAGADPALFPVIATVGGASYEKWHRLYVELNDAVSVLDVKFWKSNGNFGTPIGVQARTNATQSSYSEQTYVTPAVTTNICPHLVTETAPAGPNVGIANSLTASISGTSTTTDYVVHQLQISNAADARQPGTQLTLSWLYDEVT